MAIGDFVILEASSASAGRGSRVVNVAPGATTINPGEPVVRSLGATSVTAMATNKPVVGTDYVVGIASTKSNQTSTVSGTVDVVPLDTSVTYLGNFKTSAPSTQAAYDNLVGTRVLIDLTSGVYTVLQADSANNGCVIAPLSVALYPNKVAFAFRAALSDLS
jgi:hypothetical protein